jgi:hypothetical protein
MITSHFRLLHPYVLSSFVLETALSIHPRLGNGLRFGVTRVMGGFKDLLQGTPKNK